MQTDWVDEWKKKKTINGKDKSSEFWDGRAGSFSRKRRGSGYSDQFLEYAAIGPGRTVFDMGCGPGTLSLPLAGMGNEVYAADFSPVMLQMLTDDATELGVLDKIHTVRMDWAEDWTPYKIPVCNVAISSRSMILEDPRVGIKKLSDMSDDLVCITVATVHTPHFNTIVADAIGYEYPYQADHVFFMNLLFEMGIMPELRYINTERTELFDSEQDCVERMQARYFPDPLTPGQTERLRRYAAEHLVSCEEDGVSYLKFDQEWPVKWAFISWHK